MAKLFSILTFLLLILNQGFTQSSKYGVNFKFTPNDKLKSITKYVNYEGERKLVGKWFYSNGQQVKSQSYSNGKQTEETIYQYEENVAMHSVTGYKDEKNIDTLKQYTTILYDQHKNPYYTQTVDSNARKNPWESTPIYSINSYVYEDSQKVYLNYVTPIGPGFQHGSKRYEYDSLNRLIKVFSHQMGDSLEKYKLAEEYFYDKNLLIETRMYAYQSSFDTTQQDSKQTRVKMYSSIYAYDNKNRLILEKREMIGLFSQKEHVEYQYDSEGKLVEVSHSIDDGNTIRTYNYYLMY